MTFKFKQSAMRWLADHNYRERPERRNFWDASDGREVAILSYDHGLWIIDVHQTE